MSGQGSLRAILLLCKPLQKASQEMIGIPFYSSANHMWRAALCSRHLGGICSVQGEDGWSWCSCQCGLLGA